ncbi:AbrB/MazE/SpoVT family DNA-binding domain-containing protein [bacterium]|nr:AbrB/MazE/SpoVT family DNA-binding domain-containing protein [bacterium]
MQAVTLSSKYQISIPRSVRMQIKLTPGQKLTITVKDGVLCLAPVPTLEDIAGSLPGLTGEGLRDEGEWA